MRTMQSGMGDLRLIVVEEHSMGMVSKTVPSEERVHARACVGMGVTGREGMGRDGKVLYGMYR